MASIASAAGVHVFNTGRLDIARGWRASAMSRQLGNHIWTSRSNGRPLHPPWLDVIERMGDAMGFAADIQPLFREEDREAMDFAFDLWSYDDVKANATLILERIEDGTMPCDEVWEDAKIQALRDWIAAEFPA